MGNKDKIKGLFIVAIKEGLIEAPEGWEISGDPIFLENGLIALPVEKK